MQVAVACGVKVERFSIGFGRVIWRRQPTPGGTEFVVSALPLGGYVRWIDDQEGGVPPADEHLTFRSKPLAKRAAIVAAIFIGPPVDGWDGNCCDIDDRPGHVDSKRSEWTALLNKRQRSIDSNGPGENTGQLRP